MARNPFEPGVYAIRNATTGRVYVGGSTQLTRRIRLWREAIARGDVRRAFRDDLANHGPQSFHFEVLERLRKARDVPGAEARWLAHYRAHSNVPVYNVREVEPDNYGGFPVRVLEQIWD